MFRYCFGQILAEELGYFHKAPPIEGFPSTFAAKKGKQVITNAYGVGGYVVDLDHLLEKVKAKPGMIKCDGLFEYYPMLAPYKDKILNDWLPIEQPYSRNNLEGLEFSKRINGKLVPVEIDSIGPDDIMVNYRLGDFLDKRNQWLLVDYDYFNIILANTKFSRVFITSDNITHPILEKFDKYDAIYQTSPDKFSTFNLVRLFNKIAISQSTFSWWAAYMSMAQEIYFPWTIRGTWSEQNRHKLGLDLRVDEDRYIYVDQQAKKIIGRYGQMPVQSKVILRQDSLLKSSIQRTYFYFNRKKALLPGY